jgi:hypothetical protein
MTPSTSNSVGHALLTVARFGPMQIDTLSIRASLKSLEGLNEWSLDDRDFLIQLLLTILDGLDEVAGDLNRLGTV